MSNTLPIIIEFGADGDWEVSFPSFNNKRKWFDGELSLDEVRQIATREYYEMKKAC